MNEREMLAVCALITEGHDIIGDTNHKVSSPKVSKPDKFTNIVFGYAKLAIIREKLKPYRKSGILEIDELVESFIQLIKTSAVDWLVNNCMK